MVPALAYWQSVARGIDAEDQKLRVFVRHNLSLGLAREAILRDLIIRQTPEPHKVRTGFICHFTDEGPWVSRQCDVLVYDPQHSQPYYSIDAFAVIQRHAANLVVEVKTDLDNEALQDIVQVAEGTRWVPVPTLGFAFDGWCFETALEKVGAVVKANPRSAPDCVAVHSKNYVIFRPQMANEMTNSYTGFDFSGMGEEGTGLATAMLLSLCDVWIRNKANTWSPPKFFASFDVTKVKAGKISPSGEVGPYLFA